MTKSSLFIFYHITYNNNLYPFLPSSYERSECNICSDFLDLFYYVFPPEILLDKSDLKLLTSIMEKYKKKLVPLIYEELK